MQPVKSAGKCMRFRKVMSDFFAFDWLVKKKIFVLDVSQVFKTARFK